MSVTLTKTGVVGAARTLYPHVARAARHFLPAVGGALTAAATGLYGRNIRSNGGGRRSVRRSGRGSGAPRRMRRNVRRFVRRRRGPRRVKRVRRALKAVRARGHPLSSLVRPTDRVQIVDAFCTSGQWWNVSMYPDAPSPVTDPAANAPAVNLYGVTQFVFNHASLIQHVIQSTTATWNPFALLAANTRLGPQAIKAVLKPAMANFRLSSLSGQRMWVEIFIQRCQLDTTSDLPQGYMKADMDTYQEHDVPYKSTTQDLLRIPANWSKCPSYRRHWRPRRVKKFLMEHGTNTNVKIRIPGFNASIADVMTSLSANAENPFINSTYSRRTHTMCVLFRVTGQLGARVNPTPDGNVNGLAASITSLGIRCTLRQGFTCYMPNHVEPGVPPGLVHAAGARNAHTYDGQPWVVNQYGEGALTRSDVAVAGAAI